MIAYAVKGQDVEAGFLEEQTFEKEQMSVKFT